MRRRGLGKATHLVFSLRPQRPSVKIDNLHMDSSTHSSKKFAVLMMRRPFKLTVTLARRKATQESEHNYGLRINEEYHHADESEYWGSENAGPDWEALHFFRFSVLLPV